MKRVVIDILDHTLEKIQSGWNVPYDVQCGIMEQLKYVAPLPDRPEQLLMALYPDVHMTSTEDFVKGEVIVKFQKRDLIDAEIGKI